MSEIPEEIRSSESTFSLVSYALVAGMITCGALTLVSLINRLDSTWHPWYIAGLCFFVTLERLYTYRRYRDLSIFSKEWAINIGTEWIVILALVRVVVGLSHGVNEFLAEIPLWRQDFNVYFVSIEFLLTSVLVFLVWLVSGEFADLLDEMGLAQAQILERFPALQAEKPPARARLLSLSFKLGILLIVLTALVRVDLRAVFAHTGAAPFVELPALAGGGASTLLYFMLSLALFSQTQFIDLHTRWGLLHTPVSPTLARRWALYSLLFLGLLAAIVSFLPTSYSLGLLYTLGYGLSVLSGIFYFAFQIILSILLFLLSLPFILFGSKSPVDNNPILPLQFPKLPEDVSTAAATPAWWEMLKSLAFWVVFLGILTFSIVQYLRQHEEVLQALRKIPGAAFLSQVWKWLQKMFQGVKTGISNAVEAGRERLRARRAIAFDIAGGGFLNLRRLDPRQKVYFYYLALLRRSGETGLPRRPSQTPIEFATALEAALPTANEDIDALTGAFVEARYTRKPVEAEKANLVKATWERIRKVLRGKKVESGK